jgi:hypothetical protein
MLFFLALSCLAAATLGSVVFYQRGQSKLLEGGPLPALPPPVGMASEKGARRPATVDPTLDTLMVGDVVLHGDDDWIVAGTVTYREERDVWWLHLLEGGTQRRWLEVRQRGRSQGAPHEATLLDVVADAPTFGQVYGGLSFRGLPLSLESRGDARIAVAGDVEGRREALVRYSTYSGPGGAVLQIEEEGQTRRALFGQRVTTAALSFMPGEGR